MGGLIDAEELQGAAVALGIPMEENIARIIGAKETAKEIQEMLSTLDTDGDNELDPIDFYTCCVSGMRIRMEEEERIRRQQADQMADIAGQQGRTSSASMSRIASG